MNADSILAHQGGWDEILIIIGPIAAIVGIVALVRRRLHREAEEAAGEDGETGVPSASRGDILGP
ncbi:MAG: hypothetical protein OXE75_17030 [bacterium]|nr:hypothetical protein [bacterium]